MKGIYSLIVAMRNNVEKRIGMLGSCSFCKGIYVYNGSAFGEGSTSLEHRIGRHLGGKRNVRWHVDYLLVDPVVNVYQVIYAVSDAKLECELNNALLHYPNLHFAIRGFGSSDCHCDSHLLAASNSSSLEGISRDVKATYRAMGLKPQLVWSRIRPEP